MNTNASDQDRSGTGLQTRVWKSRVCRPVPLALAALALLAATPLAASTIIPATRPAKPILLSGGTVVTVSGPTLPTADVLIVDGRIAGVGAKLAAPAGTETIDVRGRRVYPGLIAAATHIGLVEIAGAKPTVDAAEIGALNPNARAQTAINPDSEIIPVARLNGILTALSVPTSRAGAGGRANLLSGTSTLLRLDGWTFEDLALRPMAALHLAWPETRRPATAGASAGPAQQRALEAQIRTLDDAFAGARNYARAKAANRAADTDLRWEAMLPAIRGEMPVFVQADDVRQIRGALAFAKKHELKLTILGGLDAWRVADELKAANVAVIVTGTDRLPSRRDDDFEAAYANPARLHAAGVKFCIAGTLGIGTSVGNERNLPYHAGRAAAHGLPPEIALRAITLSAAEILGVALELGSIETGKRATLIVTDGDPLEIPTQVQLAFIDGAQIQLRSRHTELNAKYSERLKRVGDPRPASAGTQ